MSVRHQRDLDVPTRGRLVRCGLVRSSMSQAQREAIDGFRRDLAFIRSMPQRDAVETDISRLLRRYRGTLESMDDALFTANVTAVRRAALVGVNAGAPDTMYDMMLLGQYGDEWWVSGGRLKLKCVPGLIRLSNYDALHGAVIRSGSLDMSSLELVMYCLVPRSDVVDDGPVVAKDADDVGTVEGGR